MGLGTFLIDRFGMRRKYQSFFERLIRVGAAGLGHGAPSSIPLLEERTIKDAFAKHASSELVIFDVGANEGDYTELVLGALRDRKLTIHAFEPDKDTMQRMKLRFVGNDRIRMVNNGLSDKPGTTSFYKYPGGRLSSVHDAEQHKSRYRTRPTEEIVTIELTTVDRYCQENGINAIDLLKIDTEGHDWFVLQGAREMIGSGRVRNIQFEFSEMNVVSRTFFADFWKFLSPQYELFRMCKDGLVPIGAYDSLLHEVYYVANFFAIAKK